MVWLAERHLVAHNPSLARPEILTCAQRLLSDSLPDRAGFDEEAEAVIRFGQDWGQRVHLRAQALHRLRVTRCTQLI
jgi:hypothetical protein